MGPIFRVLLTLALALAIAAPAAGISSGLHYVDKDNYPHWNAVNESGAVIASTEKPVQVPQERWAKVISPRHYEEFHGSVLARDILDALDSGVAYVMMDELVYKTVGVVGEATVYLQAHARPEHRGRWGAYLATGRELSYFNLNGEEHHRPITRMLATDAILAPEFYYRTEWWLDHVKEGGADYADAHMDAFFRGGVEGYPYPGGRLNWLIGLKRAMGSQSPVIPVFMVHDRDTRYGGRWPARMLRRQLSVFSSKPYRAKATETPGAYPWVHGRVKSTTLDEVFRR